MTNRECRQGLARACGRVTSAREEQGAGTHLARASDEGAQRHFELGGVAFDGNQELRGTQILHQEHARAGDSSDQRIIRLAVIRTGNPRFLAVDHEHVRGRSCYLVLTLGRAANRILLLQARLSTVLQDDADA